jgi:hypothetical protein
MKQLEAVLYYQSYPVQLRPGVGVCCQALGDDSVQDPNHIALAVGL